jgi:hypothetical protein
LAFATAGASLAAGGASPIRIELNKLEKSGEACRAYLLIDNGKGEALRSLKLDLFALDPDGVIAKRVALEVGPFDAGKTVVKVFEFAGLPCDRLARILLNDVMACDAPDGARTDCLARIETASRAASIGFFK